MENECINKNTKWTSFGGLFDFNAFKREKKKPKQTTDFIQATPYPIYLLFFQYLILSLIYRIYLLMPAEWKNYLMLYSCFLDDTKYGVTLANLFMQP